MLQQQAEHIKRLRADLKNDIKREAVNTTKKLEAFQSLQALVGDIPAGFHGWLISPDFALCLVRLIRDRQYNLIVEFGSGTSTYLELRALELFGAPVLAEQSAVPRVLTFEHNEIYFSKTAALVEHCSNRAELDLGLRPLAPWKDCTGDYSYYSGFECIGEILQSLKSEASDQPLRLLVVIDGPPGPTCHWARYPAIPVVLDACSGLNVSVDFLLDDMIRSNEKGMASAWEDIFRIFGLSYERVDYAYEKGGLLLRLASFSGTDTNFGRRAELEGQGRAQAEIASAITRVDELLAELDAAKQQAAQQLQQLQQALADAESRATTANQACDEQAAKLKSVEGELAQLKAGRKKTVVALQRVRHLARRAE